MERSGTPSASSQLVAGNFGLGSKLNSGISSCLFVVRETLVGSMEALAPAERILVVHRNTDPAQKTAGWLQAQSPSV